MRGEIPQPHPELQPGIFYPIWPQAEVAAWLATVPNSHGDADIKELTKPLPFGGRLVDVRLTNQLPYYTGTVRNIVRPYPQESLSLIATDASAGFPFFMQVHPHGDYEEEHLAGRKVSLWETFYTLRFGNGMKVCIGVELRSKKHSRENSIITITRWRSEDGTANPVIVLPKDPAIISQTHIAFDSLRQAIRERGPYSYPIDPWDWKDGDW